MTTAKLIESIRYAAGHGQAVLLSPEEGLGLTDEIARLQANAEAREGVLRRREDALRRAERERDEARLQGVREERAAVVAWLRDVAPGAYGGPIPGTTSDIDPDLDREHTAAAIAGGEHRKPRTRPTEPPPVVVVRREVVDE